MRTGLSLFARVVLGAVFVWAGVSKLLSPDPFIGALDWVSVALGLPTWTLNAARVAVPRLEVVLGLCLLAGLYLRPALVVAAGALLAFLGILVAGVLERGGIRSCGCFGQEVLDSGGPAVWIARNAVLAALALAAALRGRTRFALDGALRRRRGGERPGMLADGPPDA